MRNKRILGIELGSTRIKSVLIDESATVLAQGSFAWKSTLQNGLWTYGLDEVWQGLQQSFAALFADYKARFGEPLTVLDGMGISAMMHGYLAFDQNDRLLVPFRTWQNTNTAAAAAELSALLDFNMPLRWSASHFYQAVLDGEPHVGEVASLNTLAGYVHRCLTGKRVLGVGDASGMFPIKNGDFDTRLLGKFNKRLQEKGIFTPFEALLPTVLSAGECGGTLTPEGARLLDPSGTLQAGCPLCPPEGDAGTGMIATNSVLPRTANVSAGTSAFLMAVLERELSHAYAEIDMVTTPMGDPVAMVHVNNFTTEINAWVSLFEEVIALGGGSLTGGALYDRLFASATGDPAARGLVGYNFHAGEPVVGMESGVPLLLRAPDMPLVLADFMRAQIYAALGALSMGMRTLHTEGVELDGVLGHGGFFKSGRVSQSAMSAALGAPVTVMENAGEGGAWGVALLALMTAEKTQNVTEFLTRIFKNATKTTVLADGEEQTRFTAFMQGYERALPVERLASALKGES
ncbi:MAG: ATPase [Clostridia bacterium]|nr:ATPase [Clostridia bacterium]